MAAIAAHESNAPQQANARAASPYVTKMPAGYRDYRFINVAHEAGGLNSLGAMLGNDVAIKAYRAKTLPFPDGTIIAALHYTHSPNAENNKIFGQAQSFTPGNPTNIQFMIKDSHKYAATGGWGLRHLQPRWQARRRYLEEKLLSLPRVRTGSRPRLHRILYDRTK